METTWYVGGEGNRIAADVGGSPGRAAVILQHGGGQTRHSWHAAFGELVAAGYHVISLDARGHGESDWIASGDYSVDAQCDDLQAVIATLPAPPVLIGASMGGVCSLILLGERPQVRAAALGLIDVTPRLEAQGVEHIHRFMSANPDGFASLDEAADAVAAYNPSRPRPKDISGLARNLRRRDNGRWYWHWDPKFIEGDRHLKMHNLSQRMLAAAHRVMVPALLVRGKQSDVVSPEGVAQLRGAMPHLEFRDIEGAGHMVAGDRNDAFNSAVLDFLHRHHPA